MIQLHLLSGLNYSTDIPVFHEYLWPEQKVDKPISHGLAVGVALLSQQNIAVQLYYLIDGDCSRDIPGKGNVRVWITVECEYPSPVRWVNCRTLGMLVARLIYWEAYLAYTTSSEGRMRQVLQFTRIVEFFTASVLNMGSITCVCLRDFVIEHLGQCHYFSYWLIDPLPTTNRLSRCSPCTRKQGYIINYLLGIVVWMLCRKFYVQMQGLICVDGVLLWAGHKTLLGCRRVSWWGEFYGTLGRYTILAYWERIFRRRAYCALRSAYGSCWAQAVPGGLRRIAWYDQDVKAGHNARGGVLADIFPPSTPCLLENMFVRDQDSGGTKHLVCDVVT